jgi:hypothetical protein
MDENKINKFIDSLDMVGESFGKEFGKEAGLEATKIIVSNLPQVTKIMLKVTKIAMSCGAITFALIGGYFMKPYFMQNMRIRRNDDQFEIHFHWNTAICTNLITGKRQWTEKIISKYGNKILTENRYFYYSTRTGYMMEYDHSNQAAPYTIL